MTYGCKIMVSLTLCGFFGPPCILSIAVYGKSIAKLWSVTCHRPMGSHSIYLPPDTGERAQP